jgi:hypothetical protein
MILGIKPTVDYAFKLLLGSPKRTAIMVHFINAVLDGSPPIREVELLNPILGKETASDKLAILDVRALDDQGRWLNIEMQTTLPAGLPQRLTYYVSSLYVSQLQEGRARRRSFKSRSDLGREPRTQVRGSDRSSHRSRGATSADVVHPQTHRRFATCIAVY